MPSSEERCKELQQYIKENKEFFIILENGSTGQVRHIKKADDKVYLLGFSDSSKIQDHMRAFKLQDCNALKMTYQDMIKPFQENENINVNGLIINKESDNITLYMNELFKEDPMEDFMKELNFIYSRKIPEQIATKIQDELYEKYKNSTCISRIYIDDFKIQRQINFDTLIMINDENMEDQKLYRKQIEKELMKIFDHYKSYFKMDVYNFRYNKYDENIDANKVLVFDKDKKLNDVADVDTSDLENAFVHISNKIQDEITKIEEETEIDENKKD